MFRFRRGIEALPNGLQGGAATAISGDGSTIVGFLSDGSNPHAAIWQSTPLNPSQWTLNDLGLLPGWEDSRATGVSGNGSVVVGWYDSYTTGRGGFVWTPQTGYVDLGSYSRPQGST